VTLERIGVPVLQVLVAHRTIMTNGRDSRRKYLRAPEHRFGLFMSQPPGDYKMSGKVVASTLTV
jgi:hypothetical protein